jgi:peptide/nickel transport system permease protein
MIPVIIGISFLIYFIMDLAPGDVINLLTPDNATEEQVEQIRHELGYDRTVVNRYVKYMGGLVRGDLGQSYISKKDVFRTYITRLPATLKLAFGSMLVSMLIAIPLGIYSAVHRGTIKDTLAMVLALFGLSMPTFWLGLIFIIIFSLILGWFPSGGSGSFKHIILPALTIGIAHTAILTRTTRSSMLDVLSQDYLRTARGKGVVEKKVITKHALGNALIPILTILGTQLAQGVGGAVLAETVFAWPGVGRLIIDSVNQRDVPMVTGCIIMTTIFISLVLLAVDLLYAVVDPRIKSQYMAGGKKK